MIKPWKIAVYLPDRRILGEFALRSEAEQDAIRYRKFLKQPVEVFFEDF